VLIIDRMDASAPSRVSAGLMTPVTGKRLVRSPEYDEYWQAATHFYQQVEQKTGTSLLDIQPIVRLFKDSQQRQQYLDCVEPQERQYVETWKGSLQKGGPEHLGLRIGPAARLNVLHYLSTTAEYFRQAAAFIEHDIDLQKDVSFSNNTVQIPKLDVTAASMVICTGKDVCPWFPGVPNNPSRGDILTVRAEGYLPSEVVHRSLWIAAESDGRLTVGATYDWNNLYAGPTPEGRQELLRKLEHLLTGPVVVDDHRSGVRPTMKDYQPVIGVHQQHRNLYLLGGLGSKGALRAPVLAGRLYDLMSDQAAPDSTISYDRLVQDQDRRPLTVRAQEIVAKVLNPGDTAIDATVGNGHDTCFLSSQVAETGHVYGFDLQQSAIESTTARLQANSITNVSLHQISHADMASVVADGNVQAVMFNLGYLPGGDKALITQPRSTGKAITEALRLMNSGAVMTVLVYRGHPGGQQEYKFVESLLASLSDQHRIDRMDSPHVKAVSPVLFVITKDGNHRSSS
jgi:glycine/D-amino acid oxidase-like deaminating enzyme